MGLNQGLLNVSIVDKSPIRGGISAPDCDTAGPRRQSSDSARFLQIRLHFVPIMFHPAGLDVLKIIAGYVVLYEGHAGAAGHGVEFPGGRGIPTCGPAFRAPSLHDAFAWDEQDVARLDVTV